ncbi:MAG TPA: NGG1p interacting factor NIF3 [Candidatus Nealsonbacteria bacterium]|uniref:NGG1p interacting factor NIF3 n=1 Tax=marine sediment metagenome TaxID=412755 RepID=A0A0F9VSK1_9ZZZZ|nr:NGG1p interacting factor NIF3 [Candidatus Nealsonbacteria bacterium]HEB46740.1 NGG1p interacting factor NIF3 [Candidatus Nealsonbacteria bacterium]
MKIKEIYNLAIRMGIDSDFRGKEGIERLLKRLKEKYEKMDENQKEDFDKERLTVPFSDTRILFGDPDKEIKKILVGIDIDGGELLLAKDLGDIDLVLSHHPRGKALAGLDDVMQLQVDVLVQYGVPVNIAEKLLRKRIEEVARGIAPVNHNRAVDMAKILNISFLCIHTPSDNLVARFIEEKLKKDDPQTLGEIIKSLREVPEYREAIRIGAGPRIFVGDEENRTGKIVLTELTGGTEGAAEIYEKLAQAGAGTVIGMHISEKHREEAEKAHINVVIAGHMSSDSIGLNLFLDELEKKGIEIVPCSGLIRVKRV